MPADIQTPISLYLGLVGEQPGILLESAEVDGRLGRYSLIAWDFILSLSCREGKLEVLASDSRVAPINSLHGQPFHEGLRQAMQQLTIKPPEESREFTDLPPITRALYGYFGYAMAGLFEPKLSSGDNPAIPREEAEASLVLPANVVLFDHLHHRCCHLSVNGSKAPEMDMRHLHRKPESPKVGETTIAPGREAYMQAVNRGKELIRQGECIQTVLSNRFEAPFEGDPFVLYRRLRQVNPSPYMFYMRMNGLQLLGSSPELLVRCTDGRVETRPIAGTRPRGETNAQDDAYAEDMLADPKERAEHVMLVDLGRNDLGRIAAPGSVEVKHFMQVERFSHVMHLTSYVEADLEENLDALDVLASTFPAGTLSGAPKVRAMEIIAEMEDIPRGPYGGAIGWLGLDKDRVDLDTGITIRSMWVRDGKVHWQAGAGIVFDSVPESEWQECLNKAKVIRSVVYGEGDGDVFTY
jgi:anthranilate synthase component 1